MNDSQNNIVIVGGGPAGLQTARSYREAGGTGDVKILSRDPHAPYDRPPLTKEFLRGETSADDLPLEPPGWYEENGVDLRLAAEVASLNTGPRSVTLSGGEEVPYSACVLATGSRPALPPVDGADDPGVCVVRTLDDAGRLVSAANGVMESGGGRFIVVGSGFIGCEAAASLVKLGLDVVMLTMEDAPQEARLGPDTAREIRGWLLDLGVELHPGTEVRGIARDPDGFEVSVGEEAAVRGDGLVVGAGAIPNLELAEEAGLNVTGGIVCDASMRTSDPNVFAAGDVAFARNEAAGRGLRVEHWGDALGQGRVCGGALAGRRGVWRDVPGFWSTIGERTLKYAAWGDGWDEASFDGDGDGGGGGFTVWYGLRGRCVGVLSHERDEDYERGRRLIEGGEEMPR